MQDLEYARRETSLAEGFGESLGNKGGLRGRLEDDAIASKKRRYNGIDGNQVGKLDWTSVTLGAQNVHVGGGTYVPRRDNQDRADRFLADPTAEASLTLSWHVR